MASEGNEKSNPFTRPGFIAAAVVIALIVVCAIIILIVNLSSSSPQPEETTASAAPSSEAPSSPAASSYESVCGLAGVEMSGTVTSAPDATWAYEGTTAYPTSPTYGPGETDPAGFRYCFQHSPNGALFMAANAVSQASAATSEGWLAYALAPGTYRTELLNQGDSSGTESGTRTALAGFRVLNYDGASASIDLAVTVATSSGTVTLSSVYSLVWVDGDWKIDTSMEAPIDIASIPNVAGYTTWTE